MSRSTSEDNLWIPISLNPFVLSPAKGFECQGPGTSRQTAFLLSNWLSVAYSPLALYSSSGNPRIKKFGPCMRLDYPNVNSDLFRAHSSHDLPLDCHTFLAPCQISSMIAVTRRTVRAGSTLRFPLDTSTAIALTLVDVGQRTNRSCSCRTRYFDEQRMSSALVQSGICARLR